MIKKLIIFVLATSLFAFIPNSGQQEKKITITLSLNDWNTVLQGLNELPAKQSNPIINSITQQAQKQLSDTSTKKK